MTHIDPRSWPECDQDEACAPEGATVDAWWDGARAALCLHPEATREEIAGAMLDYDGPCPRCWAIASTLVWGGGVAAFVAIVWWVVKGIAS